MGTNLTKGQQSLLKMYRKSYEGILDDLKASVDEIMDLVAKETTHKLSIEITLEGGCIPTYTVKTESLPKIEHLKDI